MPGESRRLDPSRGGGNAEVTGRGIGSILAGRGRHECRKCSNPWGPAVGGHDGIPLAAAQVVRWQVLKLLLEVASGSHRKKARGHEAQTGVVVRWGPFGGDHVGGDPRPPNTVEVAP